MMKPRADVTAVIEMCMDGNIVMLVDGDNGWWSHSRPQAYSWMM